MFGYTHLHPHYFLVYMPDLLNFCFQTLAHMQVSSVKLNCKYSSMPALCERTFRWRWKELITNPRCERAQYKPTLFTCVHFIKVTSSDWLLPARYMKMEHQMMESTILRMTGHLGKTFALHVLMHVTLPTWWTFFKGTSYHLCVHIYCHGLLW